LNVLKAGSIVKHGDNQLFCPFWWE